MSTAADVSAGGAELRHRQLYDDASDGGSGSVSPGRPAPMEPQSAGQDTQDGDIGKQKKTFGRTPDGTGE